MSNTLYIAYCKDNHSFAKEIADKLARAQFGFDLLSSDQTQSSEGIINLIANATSQGILLLSDNFLKNEACMTNMLAFVQNSPKVEQLQVVVTDGQYPDGRTETSFDRVSNVIQYMNYWQEKYLELRKKKRSIQPDQEEAFNQRLQQVKEISSQIGDFLRIIRNKNYWTFEQMAFNDFELFFKKYGTAIQHQNYSRQAINDPRPSIAKIPPVPEVKVSPEETIEKQPETINEKLANIAPIVEEKVADIPPVIVEEPEVVSESVSNVTEQINLDGSQQIISSSTLSDNIPIEEEEQAIDEILDEMNTFESADILNGNNTDTPNTDIPKVLENVYTPDENTEVGENISDQEDPQVEEELIIEDVIIEDEDEEYEESIDMESEDEMTEDFDPFEGIEIEDIEEDYDEDIDFTEEEIIMEDSTFEMGDLNSDNNQDQLMEEEQEEIGELVSDDALGEEMQDAEIEEEIDFLNIPEMEIEATNVDLDNALGFMTSGAHQDGIQIFEEILEKNPDDTEARFLLAKSLKEEVQDLDRASIELERVLKVDPNHIGAYKLMAEIAEHNNDFLLAKSYYEKVMSLNPDAKGINYKLALITAGFFAENPKLATKYFKKAIKEKPTNDEAHFRLAQLYKNNQSKPQKARKHFESCLDLNPDHAEANLNLAELLFEEQSFQKAAEFYQNAWRSVPEIRTPERDAKFYIAAEESKQQHVVAPVLEETPAVPDVDQLVMITGATSGIGKATAIKFAAAGYRVMLTGRRDERLIKMKAEFESTYGKEVKILPFDVRQIDQVKEMMDNLEDEWKNIDLLINNAGLAKGFDTIHEGDIEHWDTMIDTNIKGLLYMTRAIAPHMVARRSGQIINVCSTAGKEVYPKGNVYCATKHAVDALTKAMRVDLHQHNIRVGQVSPGHVEETEFAFVRFEDEERAKIYNDFKPLTSSDVADAIFYMANAPAHVNIQDILMTGTQQANSNFIDRSGRS